jgi:outer membrane immunogenic protein
MKATAVGAAVIAAVITTSVATAADISRNPYPYAAPAYAGYSWVGPYLGLTLGTQWGLVTHSSAKPFGVEGGIEGGYNWQTGQFVYGIEGDLQLSSAHDTFAGYQFQNPWFGTVRGRGGIALNNILFYGTLGLAYGRGQVTLGNLTENNLHTGLAAGAGLEVGLTQNWSAKAEYLYIDFGSETYGVIGTGNALTNSVARLGVNYHF